MMMVGVMAMMMMMINAIIMMMMIGCDADDDGSGGDGGGDDYDEDDDDTPLHYLPLGSVCALFVKQLGQPVTTTGFDPLTPEWVLCSP